MDDSKKTLRTRVIAARESISPSDRAAMSAAITQGVTAHSRFQEARCVSLYSSFGAEFDTTALIAAAHAEGKIVVLPRVDRATKSLAMHIVNPTTTLHPDKWGIPEPAPDAPLAEIERIDFVLVPGVAFDRLGNRLGYGAGFYDRFLLKVSASATRLVAAFDCQIVDTVPVEPHDQRVHFLVTPTEQWDFPS